MSKPKTQKFVFAANPNLFGSVNCVTPKNEFIANRLSRAHQLSFENLLRNCMESSADALFLYGPNIAAKPFTVSAQLFMRDCFEELASCGTKVRVIADTKFAETSHVINWGKNVRILSPVNGSQTPLFDEEIEHFICTGLTANEQAFPQNLIAFHERSVEPGPVDSFFLSAGQDWQVTIDQNSRSVSARLSGLQSVDFDESPSGALLIEKGESVSTTSVDCGAVDLFSTVVNLSANTSLDDFLHHVSDLLHEAADGLRKPALLRIALDGIAPSLSAPLNSTTLFELCCEEFADFFDQHQIWLDSVSFEPSAPRPVDDFPFSLDLERALQHFGIEQKSRILQSADKRARLFIMGAFEELVGRADSDN